MTPKFIKVTAAIIIENQKVLITQRHTHDRLAEKWEFPGGKIENGETPEDCLRRELQEELGISAEIGDFYMATRHVYPHARIELLAYHARILSGKIDLHSHKAYCWASIHDLSAFDFSEADEPIVKKLIIERDQD